MNASGGNVNRLTNKNASNPDWSSDGSRITFQSTRDSTDGYSTSIYVMNADGSGVQRLITGKGSDPDWSPDGTKIAFTAGDKNNIYIMNADGSSIKQLTISGGSQPDWSPDGTRIAFHVQGGDFLPTPLVYIMNADGTNIQQLGFGSDPAWSPDGTKVAYSSCCGSDPSSGIYVMSADGSNNKQLTDESLFGHNPSWSPDGTKITFSQYDTNTNDDVYIMNADGSGQTRITNNPSFDRQPAWRPTVAVPPTATPEPPTATPEPPTAVPPSVTPIPPSPTSIPPSPTPTVTPLPLAATTIPTPIAVPPPAPSQPPTAIPVYRKPIVIVPGYWACLRGLQQRMLKNLPFLIDDLEPTTYDTLIKSLQNKGYAINQDLFISCYDWSGNLADAVSELKKKVDHAFITSGNQPVTIITHSTGGIIARYYIQNKSPEDTAQIADLIMLAPPNRGVARAYYTWEGGDLSQETGITGSFSVMAITERCKRNGFTLVKPPTPQTTVGRMTNLNYDQDVQTYLEQIQEYQKQIYDCMRFEGIQSPIPYDLTSLPKERLPILAWFLPEFPFLSRNGKTLSYPNAPITSLNTDDQVELLFRNVERKVTIIWGNNGNSTIEQIPVIDRSQTDNPLWSNGKPPCAINKDTLMLERQCNPDAINGKGDGTVLEKSARLPDRFTGRYSFISVNKDHRALVQDPAVLKQIGEIIDTKLIDTSITPGNWIVVAVASPVNLLVTDPTGHRSGVDQNGQLITDISGALYADMGDPLGPKFVFLPNPSTGAYQFDITGVGNGEYNLYAINTESNKYVFATTKNVTIGEKTTYDVVLSTSSSQTSFDMYNGRMYLIFIAAVAVGFIIFWLIRKRKTPSRL